MGLLPKRKPVERGEDKGPGGRGFLRNLFHSRKRFGMLGVYAVIEEVKNLRELETIGEHDDMRSPIRGIGEAHPKVKNAPFYGPQFAEVEKESHLYERLRKKIRLRKDDSISISPFSMRPPYTAYTLLPLEGFFFHTKNASGKGDRFFRMNYSLKDAFAHEVAVEVMESIAAGKIELFEEEKTPQIHTPEYKQDMRNSPLNARQFALRRKIPPLKRITAFNSLVNKIFTRGETETKVVIPKGWEKTRLKGYFPEELIPSDTLVEGFGRGLFITTFQMKARKLGKTLEFAK